MSEALKQCPFCGAACAGYPVGDTLSIEGEHDVLCPFHHDDPIISAEAWNTRAQPSHGALTNEGAEPVADFKSLLAELGDALEDLEIWGRHSDQGYRKLKDWYRKAALGCLAVEPIIPYPPARASVVLPEPQAWVKCIDQLPPVRERLAEPCTIEGRNIPPLNRSVPVIVYDGVSVFGDVIEWFDGALPHRGATHWCALPSAPASTESRS